MEFIRAFPDRIYHVHMKDAIVTLNGRTRHPGQPPELRRSAPRLGLPLAGPRRREFRGDHPRLEPDRLRRPAVGRVGRHGHGPRTRRERGLRVRPQASISSPAAGPSTRRSTKKSKRERTVRGLGKVRISKVKFRTNVEAPRANGPFCRNGRIPRHPSMATNDRKDRKVSLRCLYSLAAAARHL